MNFINWNELNFKKHTGKEKVRCPSCDETRTDKRDKSLLINHNDGYGKCFYCDALAFEPKENEIEYKLPEQNWKNYTDLSDNVVKYFESRKITQSTLKHFKITEEKYYQPTLKKEVVNIVFNSFEGEKLINKKYRSGGKRFTQSAGTKSIFYNINSIIGQKQCIISEGEIDAMSFHELGHKSVVSLPNGANDNDDFWKHAEKYMKDIEMFYIATDNDSKGNEVSEKIAQRLGRYRCKRLVFQGKDANEDLINGNLQDVIDNSKSYPISGTFTMEDLYEDVVRLYDDGLPKTIYPKHRCFGKLKYIFKTMRGHVCTITGIPSHGKSNHIDWYAMNLVKDYKMKASFFSPEHSPMELHQTTFIQKAFGKNFWGEVEGVPRISMDEINRYKEWSKEKIYLTSPEKGEFPTWNWLFEKFREQMFTYGIDIFVIDAFNKLQFDGAGQNKQRIDEVLTKLTMFAQMNNVIIFLVAHPTKMQKDESGKYIAPTLYDVSGSADFRNQTHDGYCIYRTFADEEIGIEGHSTFINLKTKFSFQGEIGASLDMKYHNPSGRYYDMNQPAPTFDMTKEFEDDENDTPIENVQPNEAFDVQDSNTMIPVTDEDDEFPF